VVGFPSANTSFMLVLPMAANAEALTYNKNNVSISKLSEKDRVELGKKVQEIIDNSSGISVNGGTQKATKNDKYIKSINQKRFDEIKKKIRKINDIQELNTYISSLKQDEALATIAGLLVPYQKMETITQTTSPRLTTKTAKIASANVVAAAYDSNCWSTSHYGAFKTYDGFTMSNWSFRMRSCYNPNNRQFYYVSFETEPYVYNKAWWIGDVNIYQKGCRQDGTWKVLCQFQTESNFLVGLNVQILGLSYYSRFYNYAGAYRTTVRPYTVYTNWGSGSVWF